MNHFPEKMSRLLWIFIAYFAVLFVIDVSAGWKMAGGWSGGWPGLPYRTFLAIFLPVSAVLFALGIWLLRLTAQKRRWARIVLLIVGWLTVIDALSSLLFTSSAPGVVPWLERLVPGVDWDKILLVDRAKDILALFFWGYLVYVLQFDRGVRGEFAAPGPASPGPGAPAA